MIMRQAMEGVVPKGVQWRCEKGHLAYHVMHQLRSSQAAFVREKFESGSKLKEFVDDNSYRHLLENLDRLNETGTWKLKFFTSLAYWLENKWRASRQQ